MERHIGLFQPFHISLRGVLFAGYRRLCPCRSNRSTVTDSLTVYGTLYKLWCMSLSQIVDRSKGIFFPLFILIMSDRIRKQLQEISLGINDTVVDVLFELCEEAIEENRFSIIVNPINPRRQNLRAMIGAFPRLCGVADLEGAYIVENQKIQFLFRNEESMLSVLRRGPWSFNEWMVSMQRWSPSISNEDLGFISFWVQVRGIPIQFLSTRMVTRIRQEMGQFLETDFQTDDAQNVDFVRIRILCSGLEARLWSFVSVMRNCEGFVALVGYFPMMLQNSLLTKQETKMTSLQEMMWMMMKMMRTMINLLDFSYQMILLRGLMESLWMKLVRMIRMKRQTARGAR